MYSQMCVRKVVVSHLTHRIMDLSVSHPYFVKANDYLVDSQLEYRSPQKSVLLVIFLSDIYFLYQFPLLSLYFNLSESPVHSILKSLTYHLFVDISLSLNMYGNEIEYTASIRFSRKLQFRTIQGYSEQVFTKKMEIYSWSQSA